MDKKRIIIRTAVIAAVVILLAVVVLRVLPHPLKVESLTYKASYTTDGNKDVIRQLTVSESSRIEELLKNAKYSIRLFPALSDGKNAIDGVSQIYLYLVDEENHYEKYQIRFDLKNEKCWVTLWNEGKGTNVGIANVILSKTEKEELFELMKAVRTAE